MHRIEDYIKQSKEERQKHIDLTDPCILRGGDSMQFRGLLAYYLDTEIPRGRYVACCHACHNSDCSNPKHLYWGTYSENRLDRIQFEIDTGIRETHRKRQIKRSTGKNNANYGINPWDNVLANVSSWIKAGIVYDELVLNDWDFSKYGKGVSYLQREYELAQGSAKTMIKKFNGGWNPWKDKEWVDFYNRNQMT